MELCRLQLRPFLKDSCITGGRVTNVEQGNRRNPDVQWCNIYIYTHLQDCYKIVKILLKDCYKMLCNMWCKDLQNLTSWPRHVASPSRTPVHGGGRTETRLVRLTRWLTRWPTGWLAVSSAAESFVFIHVASIRIIEHHRTTRTCWTMLNSVQALPQVATRLPLCTLEGAVSGSYAHQREIWEVGTSETASLSYSHRCDMGRRRKVRIRLLFDFYVFRIVQVRR